MDLDFTSPNSPLRPGVITPQRGDAPLPSSSAPSVVWWLYYYVVDSIRVGPTWKRIFTGCPTSDDAAILCTIAVVCVFGVRMYRAYLLSLRCEKIYTERVAASRPQVRITPAAATAAPRHTPSSSSCDASAPTLCSSEYHAHAGEQSPQQQQQPHTPRYRVNHTSYGSTGGSSTA